MKIITNLFISLLLIFIAAINILLINNVSYGESKSFQLPLVPERSKDFYIFSEKKATVKINKRFVTVNFGNEKVQNISNIEEIMDISKDFSTELFIEFDDFNFDGMLDIAVPVGYGYGGVNIFYDIFLFNKKENLFKKQLPEIGNIELNKKLKELISEIKSGPYWYISVYRFLKSKPYQYSESVVLGDFQRVEFKDPEGKTTKTIIIDYPQDGDSLKPAIRTVKAEKTYLYNEPKESSKTKMYIIKGDKVVLLDAIVADMSFIFIRYEGKKVLEKWIKSEALH